MKKIVIFASGGGSNAQAIMDRFQNDNGVQVSLVLTNNPRAGVIKRASDASVECLVFNDYAFAKAGSIQTLLQQKQPDLIVLAGFLKKIPKFLIQDFPDKIINIHPALLPKYGGKGMYGKHVHEAVVKNNEEESGITIHYVNEQYDEGAIIKQVSCHLDKSDSPDDVARKVLALEHRYYPEVIAELLRK